MIMGQRLVDRQPQTLFDRPTERITPQRIGQRQPMTDIRMERARQTYTQLERDYSRLGEDFKTYEEIALGGDTEIDPNILIELEEYEEREKQLQKELVKQESQILQTKSGLQQRATKLRTLGSPIEISPVKEYYADLVRFGREASDTRLAFITEIADEQQRDVQRFREALQTVNLSPVLVTRQEQLFSIAQDDPDLFSKPYIYDQWMSEKQLQPGMTALGYSIADLKQQEGAKVEYFDSGAIKRILAPPREFMPVKASRGGVSRSEFTPYVVEFGETGEIVREQMFAPQSQIASTWQGGYLFTEQVGLKAEVLFEGGTPIKKQEFGVFSADVKARAGSAFVTFKPFTEKVTQFQDGRLTQQAIFAPYSKVEQREWGGDWAAYTTKQIFLQQERDYVGGMITTQPTPQPIKQFDFGGVTKAPPGSIKWENPFTGRGRL